MARRSVLTLVLLGAASFSLVALSARAEQDATNGASAQALFDLGKKLMAQKKYDEACPKLVESQRLDPGTGTLLNLADCYELDGKLVSAWSTYLEAAASATTAGQSEREDLARKRAAALAPKLSNVVVNVAAEDVNIEGFQVQRDGVVVGRPQWGVPVPAELGEHKIEVTAPGSKPWETTVTVPSGAQTVTVDVPPLEALPAPPPPAAIETPAPQQPVYASTETHSWFSTHQKVAAVVVGGVGLVGVGVGTAFGLMVKPTYNKSAPYCNGDHCDPPGHDFRESAFNKAEVANVAVGIGAAALIGGAVLWLTAPRPHLVEKAQLPRITPAVGSKAAFISLQRSW